MAISAYVPGKTQNALGNKEIDWNSDNIFLALVTNAASPDIDTLDYWDDLSGSEVANGNGYATNGVQITTPTITYQSGSNRTEFDCDDVVWTGSGAGFTFRYGAYVDRTPGTNATRNVIVLVDFGTDVVVLAGEVKTVQIAATGVFTMTTS